MLRCPCEIEFGYYANMLMSNVTHMQYNVSEASHSWINCSHVRESSTSAQMLKCQTQVELRCDVILSVPDEKNAMITSQCKLGNNVSLPFELT
jgi:hypothetical protein